MYAPFHISLLRRQCLTERTHSYRFDVTDDGTLENRKTFAFASPGLPDGKHCERPSYPS